MNEPQVMTFNSELELHQYLASEQVRGLSSIANHVMLTAASLMFIAAGLRFLGMPSGAAFFCGCAAMRLKMLWAVLTDLRRAKAGLRRLTETD